MESEKQRIGEVLRSIHVEQGSLASPKSVGMGHCVHFILGDSRALQLEDLPTPDPFSVQGAARRDSRRSGKDAFFFCEERLIGGSIDS
jgi:hypothetical protein